MREFVKMLLIGDEGVGKSSLISAMITRQFPEEVPHVMTDAVLPPEASSNHVCVTIMDSSTRANDRDVLRQKIAAADSILALYDVARPETFNNLATVWLPLVKDVFGSGDIKTVLLVGTKSDLLVEDEDVSKIQSLLIDFPFVFTCFTCSATRMQGIDEVFYHGEMVVVYPIGPLYDVFTHEFTPACRRAFRRIFRIFDRDNDNLLNDAEFLDIQTKCFEEGMSTEELLAMKKLCSKEEGGLLNDCFTFEGLLHVIRSLMERHMFNTPWTILRTFDYDEELNLVIPPEVSAFPDLPDSQLTELSPVAKEFLLCLARNSYNECEKPLHHEASDSSSETEDFLTWDALNFVLSVIPPDVVHPWIQPPSYKCGWNVEESLEDSVLRIDRTVLLNGLPHLGANLSFEAWINQWHVLAMNDPQVAHVLLFRLGYVDRPDSGVVVTAGPIATLRKQKERDWMSAFIFPTATQQHVPRTTINVHIMGGNGIGKSSLVWNLSGLQAPGNEDVEIGMSTVKPQDNIVIGSTQMKLDRSQLVFMVSSADPTGGSKQFDVDKKHALDGSPVTGCVFAVDATEGMVSAKHLTSPCYLSLAAIPKDRIERFMSLCTPSCDVALLVYQSDRMDSLEEALELERRLPLSLPRLFLSSKSDLLPTNTAVRPISSKGSLSGGSKQDLTTAPLSKEQRLREQEKIQELVSSHIQANDLPPLVHFSTVTGEGIKEVLTTIGRVAYQPELGIPLQERKKTDQYWYVVGGITLCMVAVGYAGYHYREEIKDFVKSAWKRLFDKQ